MHGANEPISLLLSDKFDADWNFSARVFGQRSKEKKLMIVLDPFSITECFLAAIGERHVTCGVWEKRLVRQRVGKSIDSQDFVILLQRPDSFPETCVAVATWLSVSVE